jgi:glycosyltransferase involved in cell wall biosynthesis
MRSSRDQDSRIRHLVFVSHWIGIYGAERSLVALVEAAVQMEVADRISVVVPREGPLVELLRSNKAIDVIVRPTRHWLSPSRGVRQMLQSWRAMADSVAWFFFLRKVSPSLLIINSSVIPGPLFGAAMSRTPSVLYVRETLLAPNPGLRSAFPRSLVIRSMVLADVVVAVSAYVAQQIKCADLVQWSDVGILKAVAKKIHEGGPFRVVIVGSIQESKGQTHAIRAIRFARDLGLDVSLDIYGSGFPRAEQQVLDSIVAENLEGIVTLKGEVSDVLSVLERAHASIVCSPAEAYGRVTAESLLTGTPVFGYDLGGTSEILSPGGGVLVKPSPEALGQALADWLGNPLKADELFESAVERAQRPETFGNARQTVSSILKKVCEVRPLD